MIECKYCYTRNKNDASKCESCGAPLIDFNEEIYIPNPNKPNNFVSNVHFNYVEKGITTPGISPKQFEKRIMDVIRRNI